MHNGFLYENAWVVQLSSAGSELGWEGIIEMSAPFDENISLSATPFACANLLRLSVYLLCTRPVSFGFLKRGLGTAVVVSGVGLVLRKTDDFEVKRAIS